MAPPVTSITCNNLSFSYGDEKVLDGMNFSVNSGEHLVIRGESGSGKSTVLQLLLGFLKPDRGHISVLGDASALRRHTAWLPQDLDLGEGSVRELIEHLFRFEANHARQPSQEEQIETFRQLGLGEGDYVKAFRDLSTGQQQVLLLDEPTSALDRSSKEKAANLLLSNQERIIVSTSHDPFWVEKATKIVEVG